MKTLRIAIYGLGSLLAVNAAIAFSFASSPATGISSVSALASSQSGSQPFERIDYYVAKNQEKLGYPPDSVHNLSEAIFFIPLKPDAKGNLTTDTTHGSSFAAQVAGMKKALVPNTKLVLGLGSLTAIVGKPEAQQKFLRNLQKICADYGFKGIDIDWEDYNNGDGINHVPAYALVVQAIANLFQPQGFTISVSFGSTWEPAYLPLAKAVKNTVNYFNLQFYYSSNNSMPMSTFEQELADYVHAGIPARKIRIGLPTYGMVDPHKTKTLDKWRKWDQLLAAHVNVRNLNQWTDPANGQTYYFSSLNLLRNKIDYARSHGFAGIFTWELSFDTDYNNPLSANRLIDQATHGLQWIHTRCRERYKLPNEALFKL